MKIILFIFLSMMLFPLGNTVFAETLEEQKLNAEIAKLDAETKKLNLEIEALQKPSDSTEPTKFQQDLITSILAIAGTAFGAILAGIFAWYRSKMIVPLSDQEKLFREYVKRDLSHQYKIYWDKIRNDVLQKENDDNQDAEGQAIEKQCADEHPEEPPDTLEKYWEIISNRDFPKRMQCEIRKKHFENVKEYIKIYNITYLKKSIFENETKYEDRIVEFADSLTKRVHSDYFETVETTLPKLVTIAVTASKQSSNEDEEANRNDWSQRALHKLKWLMILNGISEYEKTVKFLIASEIQTQKDKSEPTKYKEFLETLLQALQDKGTFDDEIFEKLMKLFEK